MNYHLIVGGVRYTDEGQAWAALMAEHRAYYAPSVKPSSARCAGNVHRLCAGRALVDHHFAPCGCWCHEASGA